MAEQNRRYTSSIPSLHYLCFTRLIEEIDLYSPEILSLLPPAQRKKLLLLCPIVTICHLEQTCAFNGIDSNTFWDELPRNYRNTTRISTFKDEIKALKMPSHSSRERYFTYLTTVIFSGDRFSDHYANIFGSGPHYNYRGGSSSPGQSSCPDDFVNYLVAYRKPNLYEKLEQHSETHSSETESEQHSETHSSETESDSSEEDGGLAFFNPIPIHDVFGKEFDEHAMKGQHVHLRYSHYISKESHYRLSDEDALSLMMNECNYYPKKLFIHEYEDMHWKWSEERLTQLLTQFFSRLV